MKKSKENWFQFTKEQRDMLAPQLKEYMEEELDVEITGLQTQLLLGYVTENIGKYYYNKGIEDAAAMMSQKVEDLYVLMKEE